MDKESLLEFGVYDREAPKTLGDVFEALAGAVFLDSRSL
jgi:dsRNA-specific ribonuclease